MKHTNAVASGIFITKQKKIKIQNTKGIFHLKYATNGEMQKTVHTVQQMNKDKRLAEEAAARAGVLRGLIRDLIRGLRRDLIRDLIRA